MWGSCWPSEAPGPEGRPAIRRWTRPSCQQADIGLVGHHRPMQRDHAAHRQFRRARFSRLLRRVEAGNGGWQPLSGAGCGGFHFFDRRRYVKSSSCRRAWGSEYRRFIWKWHAARASFLLGSWCMTEKRFLTPSLSHLTKNCNRSSDVPLPAHISPVERQLLGCHGRTSIDSARTEFGTPQTSGYSSKFSFQA